MHFANRLAEIQQIDRFLSDEKRLYGAPPEFGPSNFHRRRNPEWTAVWPVEGSSGAVDVGQLRIVVRLGEERPSIALTFRGQCITRLDFVPADECEDNPPFAVKYGLPSRVCGPHIHPWETNRNHLTEHELWDLPLREPLPPQIRRFEQAFPWFADRIKLTLKPEDRKFELRRQLF